MKDTGFAEIPDFAASIGTTKGNFRTSNQDRAVIARFKNPAAMGKSFVVFLLCDGMGGMLDGDRCAEIAAANFLGSIAINPEPTSTDSLHLAVSRANHAVYQKYKGRGGTTLTAMVVGPDLKSSAISVGDSRLYAFSDSGKFLQLSVDDTIAGELTRLRGKESSASQLDASSAELAQFVGIGYGIEPRTYVIDLRDTAVNYLLSSDGINEAGLQTIEQVLSNAPSMFAAVSRLVQLSKWCGGKDNASAICVQGKIASALSAHLAVTGAFLGLWDSFSKLEVLLPPEVRWEKTDLFVQTPALDKRTTGQQTKARGQVIANAKSGRTYKGRKRAGKEASPNKSKSPAGKDQKEPQGQLQIQILEDPPDLTTRPKDKDVPG